MVAGASRCLSPVVFANKSRSNSGGVNWGFSPAGFELQQRHKSSVGSLCDFGVICYILNRSFLHAWQHPLCIVCFYAPRVFSLTRAKGGEPCRWPVRLWRETFATVAFRALFGFLPLSWHNIIFFYFFFFMSAAFVTPLVCLLLTVVTRPSHMRALLTPCGSDSWKKRGVFPHSALRGRRRDPVFLSGTLTSIGRFFPPLSPPTLH